MCREKKGSHFEMIRIFNESEKWESKSERDKVRYYRLARDTFIVHRCF